MARSVPRSATTGRFVTTPCSRSQSQDHRDADGAEPSPREPIHHHGPVHQRCRGCAAPQHQHHRRQVTLCRCWTSERSNSLVQHHPQRGQGPSRTYYIGG